MSKKCYSERFTTTTLLNSPLGGAKKKNVMAKLIAEIFERFGHVITHQRRRGALPNVAQGGG
jgi:hypothetical protein